LHGWLNAILADPGAVRALAPGLYSSVPEEGASAPYDRRAAFYDAVVGQSLYHRIMWGTSARAYARFARAALDAAEDGWFAEAGCGSLVFTAPMYRSPQVPSAVLADRSLRMLQRAARRLGRFGAFPMERVALLHSDIATLPVCSGRFASVLCLNVLHVPCDRAAITTELSRLLQPGRGRLFLSCLIRSGRWSDAYLAALHRLGELGPPQSFDELRHGAAGDWGTLESARVEGNMCFLVIRHAG
jgi:SAM-dependent methyltransferase